MFRLCTCEMAGASIDDVLDAEIGSYWENADLVANQFDDCSSVKDQANASKLRRTTSKMLERMSSRPWLRRISRKPSQGSLQSGSEGMLPGGSGETPDSSWDAGEEEDSDGVNPDDGISVGEVDRPWLYNDAHCCPEPPEGPVRTFASSTEHANIEGLFERSVECAASDTAGTDAGLAPTEEPLQHTHVSRASQCSLPVYLRGGNLPKITACEYRRWYQGSTASLPLALANSSGSLNRLSLASALPCHCPSCCSCSSANGSSNALRNTISAGDPVHFTLPRRKTRKTCPLRSSLEFKAKRSHPGSAGCLSNAGSIDSGSSRGSIGAHESAARLNSAPDSMHGVGRSRSPCPCLGQQMQVLQSAGVEAGSGQTLCEEKALAEVDESSPGRLQSPSYWLDGRVYKERVETMLDWFAEFGDQQRNMFLERLLGACNVSQMHYLSTALEPVLHESCPHNCQDLLSWLPMTISWHILSFLDPG